MKRYSNLYKKITLKYIMDIYNKQIKVNTKNKVKIYKFEEHYTANIIRIYKKLKDKNYHIAGYNIFLIKEPKYRIIMSQEIFDKLINHVVARKFLLPVLEKTLINTNVATRKNKGTHYGIKYLKKYLNKLKGSEFYALKFDISKYFYNTCHDILINLLKKKIKDDDVIDILIKIINSTDKKYVNNEINRLKEKEILKIKQSNLSEKVKVQRIGEINRIPLYECGKGLPIGNMTSQILAIFYLNELDHYIKENLHIKYYIRYMDDGVLLSNDKEHLKYCLKEIEKIVNKYKLKLNNKTKIINVSIEGLDFLGFRFYIINNKLIMKVRNDTKKRFKRKMKAIQKGKISKEKAISIISSYKGHFRWGNCYNLYKGSIKNAEFRKLSTTFGYNILKSGR